MYEIINGNNVEILKGMADGSVDMIFADPPYNMQTEGVLKRTDGSDFKGVNDDWDKFDSLNHYIEFSKEWLNECKRVLKDDGTMWVVGSFQNIYMLGNVIQELDFWILNDVVWEKTNPVPNFSGSRLTNAHETLIWFKKNNKDKFTFNYHTMKHLNGGKQEKSVWKIPLSTGSERLKDSDGKKLHNTQKPMKLLEKIILISTKEGDVVLDPFSGTATTGAAANKYKRKYIGLEENEKYCHYSEKRLSEQEFSNDEILIKNLLDIVPPRVPITDLIKKGYLEEGSTLSDSKGENIYPIEKNGKISINEDELSIHKASASLLNKVNNNGWDFWYLKKEGKLTSIDSIRKIYREKELGFTAYDIETYEGE